MQSAGSRAQKRQVLNCLTFQYALGAIYLFLIALWDLAIAPSAAVGCVAGLLPSTYISVRMLKVVDELDASQWLSYAYRSEIGKWVTMGAVFAIVFSIDYDWDPVILFGGFVLILLAGRIAPFITKGNE